MPKRLPETPIGWRDYWRDKAAKAYNSYQVEGAQKYYSEYDKAEAAAEAFEAKIRELDERDTAKITRLKNADWLIDRLDPLKSYSKSEVADLIKKTAEM